ncbi:MAG: hypothetical protein ACI85I_001945 [Arenicella sp.]
MQTDIPAYGETINIKCLAIENEVGMIPSFEITEENHLLCFEQENGITYKRALEIIEEALKEQHKSD